MLRINIIKASLSAVTVCGPLLVRRGDLVTRPHTGGGDILEARVIFLQNSRKLVSKRYKTKGFSFKYCLDFD